MAQRNSRSLTDATTVECAAERLERTDLIDVARAAFEAGGGTVGHHCGPDATAVAAVVVADRRTRGAAVDVGQASERLGVDPSRAAHAVELLERELSPPAAADDVRRLRRSVVVARELLVGIEKERACAPRLSGAVFDDVDPTLTVLADQPLDRVNERGLRVHLRRLEADLEMARLGVDLYVRVYDET